MPRGRPDFMGLAEAGNFAERVLYLWLNTHGTLRRRMHPAWRAGLNRATYDRQGSTSGTEVKVYDQTWRYGVAGKLTLYGTVRMMLDLINWRPSAVAGTTAYLTKAVLTLTRESDGKTLGSTTETINLGVTGAGSDHAYIGAEVDVAETPFADDALLLRVELYGWTEDTTNVFYLGVMLWDTTDNFPLSVVTLWLR